MKYSNRTTAIIGGVVVATLLAIAVVGSHLRRTTHSNANTPLKHFMRTYVGSTHTVETTATGVITELDAVELTSRVLEMEFGRGSAFSPYEWPNPIQRGGTERILARDTNNPNEGYVLWKKAGDSRAWSNLVTIAVNGKAAYCTIREPR